MVNRDEMEKVLSDGMELFVDEVADFFQTHMKKINPETFFEKLLYDPDVQIPLVVVMANPEMKEHIVVKAYEALRESVEKKIESRGKGIQADGV